MTDLELAQEIIDELSERRPELKNKKVIDVTYGRIISARIIFEDGSYQGVNGLYAQMLSNLKINRE